MSEILYRAARGTFFVPVGSVGGSLLCLAASGLASLFGPGPATQTLSETLLVGVAMVPMVSITSAFIGFLIALAAGVPLLTVLIYTKLDHWVVCVLAGAACAAFLAGLPERWGATEVGIIFAGATGGFAAWYGSRPNNTNT